MRDMVQAVPVATLAARGGQGARRVRQGWRALRVVGHIGTGFALALATGALFVQHRPVQRRAARWWLSRLTRILGVEVETRGVPPAQPALFVANHVSWLDIPVLGSVAPVHFLSKAEVADWPLIGRLATAAGTLYIRRGGGQVRERARQIGGHLDDGRSILVFPEGTTTDGRDVRAFHAPLFAAASDGGHGVQPVAIRYLDADGAPHAIVPFIGDDKFTGHLWRLLGEDRIRVQVHFLPLLATDAADHRQAAATAHAAVRSALAVEPVVPASPGALTPRG